jgi:hypothetical protein
MATKWKKIKGFPNYVLNNSGVIKNSKGLVRKHRLDKSNYPIIDLKNNGVRKTVRVHQLVATHFVPGRTKLRHEVNHKFGDKSDMSAKSLEYVSPSENVKHAWAMRKNNSTDGTVKKHTRKKKNGVTFVKQHKRNSNGK